jgi:hypothetical protein
VPFYSSASTVRYNVVNAMLSDRKIEATFYAAAKDKLDRRREPVNVIVELRDDNIQNAVRAMRKDELEKITEEYISAFENREHEKLIQEFMNSIPLHNAALIQSYSQLPMMHLKLKSLTELDALNRDSRVKAIYENIVLKTSWRGSSHQQKT